MGWRAAHSLGIIGRVFEEERGGYGGLWRPLEAWADHFGWGDMKIFSAKGREREGMVPHGQGPERGVVGPIGAL